jgi:hypothetical protein
MNDKELADFLRSMSLHSLTGRVHAALREAATRIESLSADAGRWQRYNGTHDLGEDERIECHVLIGVNVFRGNEWCAFYNVTPEEFEENMAAIEQDNAAKAQENKS